MASTLTLILLGLTGLLIGISLMAKGLEVLGQNQIKKAVARFTSTPFLATITGTSVTILVQSSSAVTVLSIGLINGGIMTLPQGLGILLGSNIGTTITAQLIAFDLTILSPWLVSIGVFLWLFPFSQTKALAQAILGLGLIFLGLKFFELAFLPLQNSPHLLSWLSSLGDNYFLALLTGVVVTALVQSSSAIIGLTLVLGQQSIISLPASIAIMLGSNLGTCITALLAASTGGIDGRRIALAHILLNSGGAILFFPFINVFSDFLCLTSKELPRQIANGHTFYNLFCSMLILPFIHQFATLIRFLLPKT